MKKIKLEEGEIYQKKGTLDVRTIFFMGSFKVTYFDVGGSDIVVQIKSFRRWIRRNKGTKNEVKLIGHYDFDKKKVRVI